MLAASRYLLLIILLWMLQACQVSPVAVDSETIETETAEADKTQPPLKQATESKPESVSPYLKAQQEAPSVSRDVQRRFNQAITAMKAEDWPAAETILRGLVENHPSLSGPLLNLAIVLEQQGDEEAAESFYQQAMAANANNPNTYHRYAVMLREQGRFEEAEALYLQALSVWQQDKVSHRNLAILYDIYMGRLEDALHHYQQYQTLLGEPDREVKGWIADLNRRLKTRDSERR